MTTETEGRAAADSPSAADAERDALSYEQARAELVEVVQRLESGGSTLEESLELWERGEELAGICREWLEGARARLDAVLEEEAEEDEGEDDEAPGADGPV
ncbi:exodeoxyribonuclease VII small subunit [Streptomyces sp. NBC_01187]|uniref:exodeoxyribonuclease VII small subunit n=1 Tax=Streptomyces sp. NBC_01187 TaxID=2903766 RepID=UPI00386F46E4|nr:exodeoxyribonuclease VII small subunit [Streptomyces sp. NBC_01187]